MAPGVIDTDQPPSWSRWWCRSQTVCRGGQVRCRGVVLGAWHVPGCRVGWRRFHGPVGFLGSGRGVRSMGGGVVRWAAKAQTELAKGGLDVGVSPGVPEDGDDAESLGGVVEGEADEAFLHPREVEILGLGRVEAKAEAPVHHHHLAQLAGHEVVRLEIAVNDAAAMRVLQRAGERTPVFVRFSTVAGSKGAPDSVRDPRELDDVDVGVVRAAFGVAETGSVALSDRELEVLRLLATDLDGTFLAGDSIQRRQLYRLLSQHTDILTAWVTGRGLESVLPLLSDPSLPRPDFLVCDVGATVLSVPDLHRLWEIGRVDATAVRA